jgi:hypothetical protein
VIVTGKTCIFGGWLIKGGRLPAAEPSPQPSKKEDGMRIAVPSSNHGPMKT